MEQVSSGLKHFLFILLLVHQCVGPPTKNKEPSESPQKDAEKVDLSELGLEYNRYLKEVVDALESDPEFRKKLETANEADFRNGKVAAELEYVNHHVRTKLDELKRTELQRLRDLTQMVEHERNEVNPNHVNPGHIDHSNPHTFESTDLHKLITQVRKDLAEVDRKRREEFKEYELQKKFEQEQKVKVMDEEHKKQYLHELEEQKKKHEQHEPLHHPGSKAQLEEVWEKEDHMEKQKFNPRTFFLLHDLNGDGYWDDDEVKALFVKELDKLYQAGLPEDDMREREEEMERMREHVFKETDTNGDRLISYEEFLEQTKKQEFNKDEGWETVDSQPQFTQQEYEEFERRRQEEIQRLIDQGLLQPYAPGMMPPPPPGYAHHPGQFQQHPMDQHPNQMGQHPNQMGQHPNQMGQHPNQMGQHPNQMPQHPNQMPQHPNQIPQHPNQMPQHPNQMPQHPNQMPQHPNQMPQHPNQIPSQYGQNAQYYQQGVPPPGQYAAHGQFAGQQHPAQLQQQPLSNQQPQYGQRSQLPQQNPSPPQGNQAPPQLVNQAPSMNQNIPQQQPGVVQNQGLNPGVGANSGQVQQANQNSQPQQQYVDPNQIPPQPAASNQIPNQQVPSSNQVPQAQQAPQVNQGTYGSQSAQAASYQQGNVGSNQIHSDINKAPNSIPK